MMTFVALFAIAMAPISGMMLGNFIIRRLYRALKARQALHEEEQEGQNNG